MFKGEDRGPGVLWHAGAGAVCACVAMVLWHA